MIKEEKITQEVIIKHKHCDVCETEIHHSLACSVAQCEICGKDLCDQCIGHEEYNTGDYRTVYCTKCWDIGEKYRKKMIILVNEIDELSEKWHNECKK